MSDNISRRSALSSLFLPLASQVASAGISGTGVTWNGRAGDGQTSGRSVVCFFLDGGLSHLDSFDPKPDAVADIRGEFSAIATSVPGVHFSELWPNMARRADRIAVLRSIQHRHGEHDFARRCMHSLKQESDRRTPSLGSVVQWQSKARLPLYVSIPALRNYSGALGTEFQSYPVLGPVGHQIQKSRDGAMADSLRNRMKMLDQLNELQVSSSTTGRAASLRRQQETIKDILNSSVYQKMVDTESIPDTLRGRYGTTEAGKLAILARNAIHQGMKFVVVKLSGWDMHTRIFELSRKMMPAVDQAIGTFMDDLHSDGRLDETLVLVMSEFGRTPQIVVRNGTPGRDHWPHAMNVLIAGGNVPGGQVVGNTGPKGQESMTDRHQPDDLSATLYEWLGLPRDVMLPGEDALLNTSGQVIEQLGISN
jgi:hypothetical protein